MAEKMAHTGGPLFGEDQSPEPGGNARRKRRGPPNRMNDLDYSTWMKFQKSFFPWQGLGAFAEECLYFFTKKSWEDGAHGRVLLIGGRELAAVCSRIPQPRQVRHARADTPKEVLDVLRAEPEGSEDFVLISLLHARSVRSRAFVDLSAPICAEARRLLLPERYFCVLVPPARGRSRGFPLAWAWSAEARGTARLRDEKIGLRDPSESPVHCQFFQASDDKFRGQRVVPQDLLFETPDERVASWVVPKPPPRKPHEVLHPAKFPETLIEDFISLLTAEGDTVLDPMAGTGSALIAAQNLGRNGVGVELLPEYARIAEQRVRDNEYALFSDPNASTVVIHVGDARQLLEVTGLRPGSIAYCVTSPPYWSVLRNRGSEGQRARRDRGLATHYSEDERDLGNVENYMDFMGLLESIYSQVAEALKPGGVLTVVVKNVKREHIVYPIAWDLAFRLARKGGPFTFIGNTFWCQDDVPLKPFAVGTHWVSNVLHQYCLHFSRT